MPSPLRITGRRTRAMYEKYFGIEHTPFGRDIHTGCMFESQNMKEVLGRLRYVADRQLFAVVTGDSGCGKSTLIRKFAGSLSKDDYIFTQSSRIITSSSSTNGSSIFPPTRRTNICWRYSNGGMTSGRRSSAHSTRPVNGIRASVAVTLPTPSWTRSFITR